MLERSDAGIPFSVPLGDEELRKAWGLPRRPEGVILFGERVVVRPWNADAHGHELYAISHGAPVVRLGISHPAYDPDEAIWRYILLGPFGSADELSGYQSFIDGLPDARAFVVEDRASGELLGSICLMDNAPGHLKVELASVWLTPAAQGQGINREACLLLVDHLFSLGYRRIDWRAHAGNHRSRRAAMSMGFRLEAVQDEHMVRKGCITATAWFRLLASERGRRLALG